MKSKINNYRQSKPEMVLVRKDNLIIKGTSNVARFPNRLKERISEIEIGDKLYFSNIHVIMPGERKPRKISDSMFVVE